MCFQGQVDIGPELGNYTVSKSELIISCRRGEARGKKRRGERMRGKGTSGEEEREEEKKRFTPTVQVNC